MSDQCRSPQEHEANIKSSSPDVCIVCQLILSSQHENKMYAKIPQRKRSTAPNIQNTEQTVRNMTSVTHNVLWPSSCGRYSLHSNNSSSSSSSSSSLLNCQSPPLCFVVFPLLLFLIGSLSSCVQLSIILHTCSSSTNQDSTEQNTCLVPRSSLHHLTCVVTFRPARVRAQQQNFWHSSASVLLGTSEPFNNEIKPSTVRCVLLLRSTTMEHNNNEHF